MKIQYNFDNRRYNYEPSEEEFKNALIEILCNNVKSLNNSVYNKFGAYQMATYILKLLEQDLDYDLEKMFGEWFLEEIREHFYKIALYQFNEDIAKEENDRYYDLHKHN